MFCIADVHARAFGSAFGSLGGGRVIIEPSFDSMQ